MSRRVTSAIWVGLIVAIAAVGRHGLDEVVGSTPLLPTIAVVLAMSARPSPSYQRSAVSSNDAMPKSNSSS